MTALLDHLSRHETSRPISRRVAALQPEIESALEAGYSLADIVVALNVEGIVLSASTLTTYLYRLRKRAVAQAGKSMK